MIVLAAAQDLGYFMGGLLTASIRVLEQRPTDREPCGWIQAPGQPHADRSKWYLNFGAPGELGWSSDQCRLPADGWRKSVSACED